ncbi:hypothetical protein [Domibacillus epiphyticus]|uniref:Uncharacterized protein n=1 Tax=Domibacillus epiphyticus TaxID=1714355 RepID=A0A1V2A8P5_9BACI|nr:hypothetical protein [Domibacillus epiphyticus]OMP67327.1 hypothetical protein BTO28_07335 [Domibacillus epiphyticus]
MNSTKSCLELHKEYLLSISVQNRPGKMDQFEVLHLDLQGWLQKEQGLSLEQAKAVIEDSNKKEEVA